jgi:hypothetical protein
MPKEVLGSLKKIWVSGQKLNIVAVTPTKNSKPYEKSSNSKGREKIKLKDKKDKKRKKPKPKNKGKKKIKKDQPEND